MLYVRIRLRVFQFYNMNMQQRHRNRQLCLLLFGNPRPGIEPTNTKVILLYTKRLNSMDKWFEPYWVVKLEAVPI